MLLCSTFFPDNQQSATARDVDPYYLSPREATVTGQGMKNVPLNQVST